MQTYWDGATSRWVTKLPDGTVRAATSAEALYAYSNGAKAPVGSHGPPPPPPPPPDPFPLQRFQQPSIVLGGVTYTWNARTGKYEDAQGRASGDVVGPPPTPPPPAAPAPPVSYDPQGGGATYTPGISFGAGTLPGHGENYQRQWFDVGPSGSTEGLNQTYYDDPGNWGYAWDKVLNHFGGQVGGDFYKFLQGFSNTARGDFQNSVPYDPTLHVANFLDQYAPQIAGVYKLQPSAQTHGGGSMGLAGRATY
jgi:hypothetical protein